jgi:hypothetical protein
LSIETRLQTAQRGRSNRSCQSCQWWQNSITDKTRQLVNEWIDADHSLLQLHDILTQDDDDDPDNKPLRVSITGWRMHLKHHDERCRGRDAR